MADFIVTPPATSGISVRGEHDQFPVRHVYYVGHNYAAHARKMDSDPNREPPFFLCKPANAVHYIAGGETGQFIYPTETKDCHYKTELVVAIGTGRRDTAVETAAHHVYDCVIDLDITRRDLQDAVRRGGRPWEIGKAFDGSASIGPIVPVKDVVHPDRDAVTLSINSREYQRDDLSDPIWSVPETVAYLSHLFELRPGGLVYTDALESVGPIAIGDLMANKTGDVGELHVRAI